MVCIFTCGYPITVLKVISSAFIVNQNNKIVYFDRSTKLNFSSQLINKRINMKRFHAIDFSDLFNGHQSYSKKQWCFETQNKIPEKGQRDEFTGKFHLQRFTSLSHFSLHLSIETPILWLLYQKDEMRWDQGFPKCLFHI